MKRTPLNALRAVGATYAALLLAVVVFGHLHVGSAVVLIIPALLVGLLISGHLTVVRTQDGFRLVDPKRTPAQMEAARKSRTTSETFEPQVNINGLPMVNGMDTNGNPFGSTANDPK